MNTQQPGKERPVIKAQHELRQRQDWSGKGIPWVQNYVSLPVPDKETTIDFYEYFWDIYMVHEARFSEAYKLLSRASQGARTFYKNHPELLPKATDLGEFGRKTKFRNDKGEFRPAGYLKLLGPFFTLLAIVLPYLPFILKFLDWWAGTRIPVIGRMFEGFSALMKEPVPDFIGDLVRYLDLDPRSENFETRRRIINGALEELRELIRDDSYSQIIIVGHSLGSVIAYDALNRIILEANAEGLTEEEASKIKGLVTFGSPLDKIACFFRERVDSSKEVQRQVLANLHGFRARPMEKDNPEEKPKFDVDTPIKYTLDKTRWLNFYHTQDLISGRLDLYDLKNQPFQHLKIKDGNGNIPIKEKFGKLSAHGCYWGKHQDKGKGKSKGTNEMYQVITEEFFQ